MRTNVGVCDVTTLGKIDVKGPDAAELLNKFIQMHLVEATIR